MSVILIIGIIIGGFIALIILYLAVVIFFPGFKVPKQPLPIIEPGPAKETPSLLGKRESVSFKVKELSISAYLYLPENLSTTVPCIIMNHGFGGTKDMLLENYALRFSEAGFAVLTYDYRYFGESEGEPRQLFLIKNQLDDCAAVVEYARNRKEINPDRIAIWGTSAGGGYGLIIAAEDEKVTCLCAQCAGLDTERDGKLAVKREGVCFFLRLFMHAQRDMGRSRFGLSTHKVPIVGQPGTLAMITGPGAFEGYSKLANPGFINEVCARVILRTHGYNPTDYIKDVTCPILIQVCEKDNLVSQESADAVAKIMGDLAVVKTYPIGHFDIYTGENFEKAVADQIQFFKLHL